LKKVTAVKNLDIDTLAGMTAGMVGADLANLVNEAALLSVRRKKAEVGMSEFEEAIERVVAGLEKKNRLINSKEKKIVAYHELGHAVVAITLPETDPVQKISIIPRGIAALGYTMQVPTGDRFLMGRTELLNRIATLLGGRAAEEIFFDDISTGAQNDLSRATDIARSMVKEYGMSRKLGQVYFAHDNKNRFMIQDQSSGGEYSEYTANLIDREIRQIIDEQYERVLSILKSKRDLLDEAAARLLKSEVIEGEELKELADAVSKSGMPEDDSGTSPNSHSLAA
jgi:cell division protease FtsH